ncbi:MAG: MlaD family protein [Terriglobales bacterium]
MPSQQQVRWSQLRVGIVVIVASIALGVLIFLMSGSVGLFTSKLTLHTYVDNASGLRVGAPVRLDGVDIGNVTDMRVVPQHEAGKTPVEITFKIGKTYPIRKDTTAMLATAGVLGETFVDLDSRFAKAELATNGDTLPGQPQPDIQDVIRSSQGTLQNVDVLLKRVDRIVTQIESGNGTIGKLIYDESLYSKLNSSLNEVQGMITEISSGKGSVGKLLYSDEMYNKLNATIDKMNGIVDQVNNGNGTVGKLLKDPALYNNANETIAKANQLMADVNAGKGALGLFAKDPEFAKKLNTTIANLQAISDKMNSPDGTVGKLLTDASVYNNTDQTIVEMRELLKAVRENPKKYLTIHMRVF